MRILVVYYSRTGRTARVAERIAAAAGADLEALRDVAPRGGLRGWWRSGTEAFLERPAAIREPEKDPADYDLTVLGTPVWAGKMASPVRTYVSRHAPRFRSLALFCTEGGMGGEKVLEQVARLGGRDPVARLVVMEDSLRTGTYEAALAPFVESFERASR